MRKVLSSFALLLLPTLLIGQDTSIETFNAIRLEHSSNPGNSITLSAPTGATPYNIVLPSNKPSGTRRYGFSLTSNNTALSWYATPFGQAGQLPFFESTEELTGSPNLLWDNTAKTMKISSDTTTPMLWLAKDVNATKGDTMLKISSKYRSTGGTRIDVGLIDFGFDGTQLGNGSTVTGLSIDLKHSKSSTANPSKATGLYINVTGADTNRAAIITGGNSGFGTTNPSTRVDIAGDFAMREYNYTANLATTNDNVDFDGQNNRHSFYRIASSTTSQISISGIKGGYDGKLLILYNATGYPIRLKHSNSTDTTNRIKTGAKADVLLLPGNSYQLIYSGTEKNWVVAFSGPGELAQLGNKEINLSGQDQTLPSSVASYIQVTTPNVSNVNTYTVALEDGTTPGQILVVQNKGPKKIAFNTTNAVWDNTTDLQAGESIILVWNGTKWVQVARASN
jgi:hypothetical protein